MILKLLAAAPSPEVESVLREMSEVSQGDAMQCCIGMGKVLRGMGDALQRGAFGMHGPSAA